MTSDPSRRTRGRAVRGEGAGAGERRAGEVERFDDAAAGLGRVRVARDLADDHAEQDVVRVRVRPVAAVGFGGSASARRTAVPGDTGTLPVRARREVGQATGVGEKRQWQGDGVARSRRQTREVIVNRVREAQAVFGGELQHDRCDERLRDAPGPEVVGAADPYRGRRIGSRSSCPRGRAAPRRGPCPP